MKQKLLFLFFVLVFSQAQALSVITEDLPPLSFYKDGEVTGCSTEMVREIMKRVGENAPVEIKPWARGYKNAQGDGEVALFSTARTPEREDLFQWVGPISDITDSFYARYDSQLMISTLEDARSASKIAVLRESYTEQQLKNDGFTNLVSAKTPELAIRLVLTKRIPFLVASNLTIPSTLEKLGEKSNVLIPVFTVAKTKTYIAFSKNTPSDIVSKWQAALDEMKADGTFARIHQKYFPNDTPPN
jgi:polar amino acid transport system substrate-binding protein